MCYGSGIERAARSVVLTGQAPIWMYLRIAHALHGKARRLLYSSPVTERWLFSITIRSTEREGSMGDRQRLGDVVPERSASRSDR
ncbi:MAG TPA: CRISPR-associated protein Csx3 [Candidatus Eisenbacteria bacterium]|nr:CRISPR-associated protein Csx3 [Candidatus Eisenbacteria bacterium]